MLLDRTIHTDYLCALKNKISLEITRVEQFNVNLLDSFACHCSSFHSVLRTTRILRT